MGRRTKRRYAHELYPHADEYEVRPLADEVPYRYAISVGLTTWGTGWIDTDPQVRAIRIEELVAAREIALVADALHQGMAGDEAWAWAQERMSDDDESIYDRAVHYGVDVARIKPYPCGETPKYHNHMASTGDVMGVGILTRIDVPEDECETCTEEVPE